MKELPLVRGGRGHSDQEVIDSAYWAGLAILAGIVVWIVGIVCGLSS